jgi:hypothetical protein
MALLPSASSAEVEAKALPVLGNLSMSRIAVRPTVGASISPEQKHPERAWLNIRGPTRWSSVALEVAEYLGTALLEFVFGHLLVALDDSVQLVTQAVGALPPIGSPVCVS